LEVRRSGGKRTFGREGVEGWKGKTGFYRKKQRAPSQRLEVQLLRQEGSVALSGGKFAKKFEGRGGKV